jgi:hypothetical protein
VGIEIGDPPWNNVILDTEDLETHAETADSAGDTDLARPRFYVLHPADIRTLEKLHKLFPHGWSSIYRSEHPHRAFVLFYVPRRPGSDPQALSIGVVEDAS